MTEDQIIDGWYIAARSRDIKNKPVSSRLFGKKVVIFRTSSGITILEDRCPHRNVPLSKGCIIQDSIQCPYHGWRFNADGACIDMPGNLDQNRAASINIPRYKAQEKEGVIWIWNGEKTPDKQPPAIYNAAKSHDYLTLTATARASIIDACENFLDGLHTHYVHTGILRVENKRQLVQADIYAENDLIEITYKNEPKQSGWLASLEPERQKTIARFRAPSVAELEYHYVNGTTVRITAYITPSDEKNVYAYAVISTPKGIIPAFVKNIFIRKIFSKILQQDIEILEQQTDNNAEFNTIGYTSVQTDLIRPYLERILTKGNLTGKCIEKTIELMI